MELGAKVIWLHDGGRRKESEECGMEERRVEWLVKERERM